MKTKLLLSSMIIGLFALVSSCDKFSEINFTMSTGDFFFDVQPDTITGAGDFGQKDISINLDSILTDKGIKREKLKSANLKAIKMTVETPPDGNFDAISYFTAELGATGLNMIEIASLNPVPKGSNSIDLTVTQTDLLEYILSDTFTYKLKGSKSQPITQPMKIKVHMDFNVVGDILE